MMEGKVFIYIWEYIVKQEFSQEFREVYGPQGKWVQLFKQSRGYIASVLYQDESDACRFMTIDTWQTKEDCDNFKKTCSAEYELLDSVCEKFTVQEKLIGKFYKVNNGNSNINPVHGE